MRLLIWCRCGRHLLGMGLILIHNPRGWINPWYNKDPSQSKSLQDIRVRLTVMTSKPREASSLQFKTLIGNKTHKLGFCTRRRLTQTHAHLGSGLLPCLPSRFTNKSAADAPKEALEEDVWYIHKMAVESNETKQILMQNYLSSIFISYKFQSFKAWVTKNSTDPGRWLTARDKPRVTSAAK